MINVIAFIIDMFAKCEEIIYALKMVDEILDKNPISIATRLYSFNATANRDWLKIFNDAEKESEYSYIHKARVIHFWLNFECSIKWCCYSGILVVLNAEFEVESLASERSDHVADEWGGISLFRRL